MASMTSTCQHARAVPCTHTRRHHGRMSPKPNVEGSKCIPPAARSLQLSCAQNRSGHHHHATWHGAASFMGPGSVTMLLHGSSRSMNGSRTQRTLKIGSSTTQRNHRRLEISSSSTSDQVLKSLQLLLSAVPWVDVDDRNVSLVLALSAQAARKIEQAAADFSSEAVRYLIPRANQEAESIQDMLMTVPDLETIPSRVVRKGRGFLIRQQEAYVVAEVVMKRGSDGFDFVSSSDSFNTLAGYLFGKNVSKEEMSMTTPVVTKRGPTAGRGVEMAMTTPVITQQGENQQWTMSFIMPSKYGTDGLPLPVDDSVTIREVPPRLVASIAFPGFVTSEAVAQQERLLKELVAKDGGVRVKESSQLEVAQYNPPFTLPFARRNEVIIEVETTT